MTTITNPKTINRNDPYLNKFYTVRPHYNSWIQYTKRARARGETDIPNYSEYLSNHKGLADEEIKQILNTPITQKKEKLIEKIKNKRTKPIYLKITIPLNSEETDRFYEAVKSKYGALNKMNIEFYKEEIKCKLHTLI